LKEKLMSLQSENKTLIHESGKNSKENHFEFVQADLDEFNKVRQEFIKTRDNFLKVYQVSGATGGAP
jgi:hypothetical protein